MDTDRFWTVIESARAAGPDGQLGDKPFDEALVDLLAALSKEDILEFQTRFDEIHDAVYRWDVWAAAYLIGGGCSDDSFIDFRAGLIALGREWYERAAADPDSLAEHPAVIEAVADGGYEALFNEDVNYVASRAFERVAAVGEDFYEEWKRHRSAQGESGDGGLGAGAEADMGEDFDFDDDEEMSRRLPRLAALYLDELVA
ncbi:DUF4240 domain-containing protein [Streptomyces sp. NBS 14/10]|uniref:DUF4240 domain-containing protein n=1 Tax=Streptomyces sp. NBS 14/10 TaxID=1945643 RepID=UPI000B7C8349|nr:DUF4240 domain-containing protein [Streptomyces sp. NBS 14/10]KAK1181606.1 DUF4240 domain-containing protein [Streptomyces sp. NBS 14/10]